MKKFVMFGQNPMFGDYADLVHALGGRLSRVVVNVPDPPRENQKSFADRVAEYNHWLAAQGDTTPLQVVDLEDFVPAPEETAVLGFRGRSSRPLRERLKREFGIEFPPLIHPTAYVSPMSEVGEGTIVLSLADMGSFAKIGAFGVLNRCASMGHDTIAGDDVGRLTECDHRFEYPHRGCGADRDQLHRHRAHDFGRVLLRCGWGRSHPGRAARGDRGGRASGREKAA